MKLIRHISGFLKVEHTLFSLPLLFAGAALGLAGQGQSLLDLGWARLVAIVLAGVGARTFALSLNRLMDRKIDARNPRTAKRELPAGRLSVFQAWGIALLGFLIYIGTAFGLGLWPLVLAPIPLVVFTVYPLMKKIGRAHV
jgi:4-hydroxybenzoate polyprenyltransferase